MPVSKEYYKDLSVDDLVQDDFFIKSVKAPDENTDAFWNEFLRQYPGQRVSVEAASSIIHSLTFSHHQPPAGSRDRVWQSIISGAQQAPVVKLSRRRSWIWAAAAIVGVILMMTAFLFWPGDKNSVISSRYGEIKQVLLPDQSQVTLNANSTIEYRSQWKKGQPREVWLKGEGFFDVTHLHNGNQEVKEEERFIVHAGSLVIEVLGTSFNVSDRQSITKVVLEKGSIRVVAGDSSLLMQPGERVEFDQQKNAISRGTANVQQATSWKRKELMLDHTTVQEVVDAIEENFGYKVVIENNNILGRQITGTATISMENEETLFKALEVILQIDIRKEDNTLHIKNR